MDGLGPFLEMQNVWALSRLTELEPAFNELPS